jgi:DNA polymerase-3 subunit delta
MVAIKADQADRFLLNLPEHVFFYLFFGADAGLVSERVRATARRSVSDPSDPFQLVRLDGDAIASDPMRLADEANTVGLFGGKRAIWVDAGSKNLIPACEPLFAMPPRDCVVVVGAGALKRDSALRRLAEQEKLAAAVECNADDARSLETLIDREATAAGLTMTSDARELLCSLLGADRLTTRAELSKLLLYSHGRGSVDVAAVETIVADASTLEVDAAIHGAFSGRFDEVTETLGRIFATGGDGGVLLGQALRHATALHRAKLEADSGTPLETAIERAARAPFHIRKIMLAQARLWQATRLARAIDLLAEAIRRTRREPNLSQPIAMRALWSVALASRARAD